MARRSVRIGGASGFWGDSATGASDSVIACSVRLRRARSAIAPRSNEISSLSSI